ncbi:MAG TPA: type II toxin-antitoxin system HigB family toxin [Pyrinomonadaceae bacterium]|nr:type II toxin-antitoxin system HigB family toxin [Pyrinomonadaceae bacterium]
MRLVGKELLAEFERHHADIKVPLTVWISEVEDADWKGPVDIKARYPSASLLSDNRVVFNIKGNKYRIETKVSYEIKVVLARRIGTHAEYSKWAL